MILVTIGTSEPFDRLLQALEALPQDEEIVLQCGTSSAAGPSWARRVAYLSADELAAEMHRARVVVMHAGVGSIITALEQDRRPVVVPRLRSHGEAVDDHQVALGRRLERLGHVRLVEDLELLPDAIASPPLEPPQVFGDAGLIRELRDFLVAAVAP
jgi:UDP-N-acetylglucosamine--N-acetylmuramyl-(pentapeptide) pyrophosphoryl-undecaprenol N-acetylglucosamine transferase